MFLVPVVYDPPLDVLAWLDLAAWPDLAACLVGAAWLDVPAWLPRSAWLPGLAWLGLAAWLAPPWLLGGWLGLKWTEVPGLALVCLGGPCFNTEVL